VASGFIAGTARVSATSPTPYLDVCRPYSTLWHAHSGATSNFYMQKSNTWALFPIPAMSPAEFPLLPLSLTSESDGRGYFKHSKLPNYHQLPINKLATDALSCGQFHNSKRRSCFALKYLRLPILAALAPLTE